MREAELGQLNLEEPPPLGTTRSVDCFQKLELVGRGTYGQVYMAKEVKTGEIVALKQLRTENEKEGFPITAIREIKVLTSLRHENVVKLKEVVTSQGPDSDHEQAAIERGHSDKNKYSGSIYLVFEYMDHDLTGLSDRPGQRFTVPQIKCYMKQLLTGLHYCHTNKVLHRDIKGANILLDNNGSLKLGDFGLACSLSHHQKGNLTNRVITVPYRPPELLLGATEYGPAVDIWSAGCIFAELLNGKRIMSGKNEPEQLHKIFELCGSPDENSWPGVSKLPWYKNFNPARPTQRRLRQIFRHFSPDALNLLDRMLTLDPRKRISAKDALDARYFFTEPLPCDPKCLPKYEASHEFQTNQKRKENEEVARRQMLLHPPPHTRLAPIQHGGQVFKERWPESNLSADQLQRPFPTGPNNSYENPLVDSRLSNRYSSNGNVSGGYNQTQGPQAGGVSSDQYQPQGRTGSYPESNMPNQSTSSYVAGPPGFSQRPSNPVNNRNQHYNWRQ